MPSGFAHGGNIQPLKLVVERDVDHKRWQLHTEYVNERSDCRTTAANANRNPATSEHRNVATTRTACTTVMALAMI